MLAGLSTPRSWHGWAKLGEETSCLAKWSPACSWISSKPAGMWHQQPRVVKPVPVVFCNSGGWGWRRMLLQTWPDAEVTGLGVKRLQVQILIQEATPHCPFPPHTGCWDDGLHVQFFGRHTQRKQTQSTLRSFVLQCMHSTKPTGVKNDWPGQIWYNLHKNRIFDIF